MGLNVGNFQITVFSYRFGSIRSYKDMILLSYFKISELLCLIESYYKNECPRYLSPHHDHPFSASKLSSCLLT